MENIFIELHKETFCFLTNVIEKTTEYVAKKMNELPFVLVKSSFCRQRIFVRIKFLNLKKKEKSKKRVLPQVDREISKKMKKIVS